MVDVPVSKFLHIYGDLLVQCWSSPELKERFLREPEVVLKEFGLDPEGAKVTLIAPRTTGTPGDDIPETQARMWNEGKRSGHIEFSFPDSPPPEVSSSFELSDAELAAVAGGATASGVADSGASGAASGASSGGSGGISCCCCTPCCCCS